MAYTYSAMLSIRRATEILRSLSRIRIAIVVAAIAAVIVWTLNPDPREERLNADLSAATPTPSPEEDAFAYTLKEILERAAGPSVRTEGFEYFSRQDGTKNLVLVEVPEHASLEDDEKHQLIDLVDLIASGNDEVASKDLYLGVRAGDKMSVVYTPEVRKAGSSVRAKALLDFYQE